MINLEGLEGCLYLRKSRKDIEGEREAALQGKPFDTLDKHREELFRMVREHKLTVIDVFPEIVSGEFIAERPFMQKLMENLAEGKYQWVGVMDEDRLGRGDKIDQGRIERAFKQSGALIITPGKIVNMDNEADEQYMDYKGMGARYEYKQTKKRLHGGRKRSAARGNYVYAIPPFGYLKGIQLKTEYPEYIKLYAERAVDIENLKLYPHPKQAEHMKQVFRMVIEGSTMPEIVQWLNQNTLTPTGKTNWNRFALSKIIKNPVYTGAIRHGYRKHIKQEDGSYRSKLRPAGEVQTKEEAHIPLVSKEDFEKVTRIINGRNHVPLNLDVEMVNPLAGILLCDFCGLVIRYKHTNKREYHCKPLMLCTNVNCRKNHSTALVDIEERILSEIDRYFNMIRTDPTYIKQKQDRSLLQHHERKKKSIQQDIEKAKAQKNNLHDLLEQKAYTVEVFLERQSVLLEKIKSLDEELKSVELLISKENDETITQKKRSPAIKNIIQTYKDAKTPGQKNKLLKSVIQTIYYRKEERLKRTGFDIRIVWKELV